MTSTNVPCTPSDMPTHYEIRVRGAFCHTWCDLTEDATFEVVQEKDQIVTVIHAVIPDQAALAGLLDALFRINATVLSVTAAETA